MAPQGGAGPASAPVTASEIAGVLALQEQVLGETEDALRNRRARRHGEALLAALAALQRALLDGDADPAALQRLATLSQAPADAADPALAATVRALALRAAIELARRGF